jgi:predicted outer membrane repeat protein
MFERLWIVPSLLQQTSSSSGSSRPFRRARRANSPTASGSNQRRLTLERLEDRLAPATLTVNSIADTANASDPYLSLREAVAIVNSPTLPNGLSSQILHQISGTLHAGGADTLGFDPGTVTGPIVLGGTQLVLSLPASTATVTLDGGSARVTVDGNDRSRILQVNTGVQAILDHLTITHGSTSDPGGGIYNAGNLTVRNSLLESNSAHDGGGIVNYSTLTVTSSTLSANSAYYGGGIYSAGTVTVTGSTLSSNSANLLDGGGGGIYSQGQVLTLTNSTLQSNSAAYGGGISCVDPALTISGCTISSNSASRGGGLFNNGQEATVLDSTFDGNLADQGGGIFSQASLTVTNSTLSSNSASNPGGGIFAVPVLTPAVLQNTLLAGNLAPAAPDMYGPVNSSSSNNLISSADSNLIGMSNGRNGNLLGTRTNPIDPRLGPLADNGGPTLTRSLLSDSPARGAGSLTFATTTDQRGLPRTAGGEIDLGAFQTQAAVAGPQVVLSEPGGTLDPPVNQVQLTFNHPMDSTTLTPAQFSLTGPGGVIAVTGVTAVTGTNNQQFDVAFASQTRAGDYALTVSAAIRDSHGTQASNPFTARFTLTGTGPSVLTVNSTADTANDSDPYLTLREAITLLNSPSLPSDLSPQIRAQISGTVHGGDDHIVFDPGLAGAAIVLSGTQIELSWVGSPLTIDGGTAGITLDGNNASRIFQVDSGVRVSLTHLTVQDGNGITNATFPRVGGGINNQGILTLTNCTVTGNVTGHRAGEQMVGEGGGIASDGVLTIDNCTLRGNSSDFSGGLFGDGTVTVRNSTLESNTAFGIGGGFGGAIGNGLGTMTVQNCTFRSNLAAFNIGGNGFGGAIDNSGTLTVANCWFESNSANASGGGAINNEGTATVTDCTFASNVSGGDGGAIANDFHGMLTATGCAFVNNQAQYGGAISDRDNNIVSTFNCTFCGNSADYGGAIEILQGTVALIDTTVSGNSALQSGGGLYTFFSGQTVFILRNTIVAGNTAPSSPDLFGPVNSISSYNLVGNGTGLTGISNGLEHNQVGTSASPINALLTPLGWYGGPTQTMALLPGSPAHLTGDPAFAGGYDQRGQLAAYPGPIDIGSFQVQANPFVVTTLTDPGRQFGLLSLREAVNLADALPGDNTVSFSTTFDSGTVTLTAGELELSGAGGVRTIDGGNRITLSSNHASRLFLIDATVRAILIRLNLANGSSDSGGAIFNSGILTLAYSTLYGNAAVFGGAICNVGALRMYGSTLGYNFAYYQGGGLFNASLLTAFNDTFLYNTAFHDGGAIYTETGSVTLTSLTISLNNSANGGGLAVTAGSVLLHNCIVAGNLDDTSTAASDIAGTLSASSSYNLIGTGGSGGLSDGSNHNHVGVADPGLTTPDFSSTLSPVFGFTSSSPALGMGDPTLLSDPLLRLDQHGNVRSNPPNIGAV